jgi:hypothetical protein
VLSADNEQALNAHGGALEEGGKRRRLVLATHAVADADRALLVVGPSPLRWRRQVTSLGRPPELVETLRREECKKRGWRG